MKKFLAALMFLFLMTSFCVFADDYAYSEDYEAQINKSLMSYIVKTATIIIISELIIMTAALLKATHIFRQRMLI